MVAWASSAALPEAATLPAKPIETGAEFRPITVAGSQSSTPPAVAVAGPVTAEAVAPRVARALAVMVPMAEPLRTNPPTSTEPWLIPATLEPLPASAVVPAVALTLSALAIPTRVPAAFKPSRLLPAFIWVLEIPSTWSPLATLAIGSAPLLMLLALAL